MDIHDDTPSEWSFHSSLYDQQQQQQQQQPKAAATKTMMSMSSSPVVNRTRKAPSPSTSPSPFPSEAAAAGTPPSCSVPGPKRARLDGDFQQEKSACSVVLPGGINFGSDGGSCMLKCGKPEEAPTSADIDHSSGSCCSFQWSKGGQRDSQRSGSSSHQSAEGGNQQHGGSNGAGLGGGMSATHPSGMDMDMNMVVGGGARHEARSTSEHVMKGGEGEGGIGNGVGVGSGSGNDQPGGGAVISSGFGAGGFPKHQWHQDQGGSSDDMLILYGSPS